MTADISTRPDSSEYATHFERYVSLVPEAGVMDVMEKQLDEVVKVFRAVARERESYRYAPGKWSVRQLAGHVTDAERVFGYRVLCVARGEKANLPSFDENAYVANASFDAHPLEQLADEFALIRRSNLVMFRHWPRKPGNGKASPIITKSRSGPWPSSWQVTSVIILACWRRDTPDGSTLRPKSPVCLFIRVLRGGNALFVRFWRQASGLPCTLQDTSIGRGCSGPLPDQESCYGKATKLIFEAPAGTDQAGSPAVEGREARSEEGSPLGCRRRRNCTAGTAPGRL